MGSDCIKHTVIKTVYDFNPRFHTGSDRAVWGEICSRSHFNPRSHTGSDRLISKAPLANVISIHAPAWGATQVYSLFACGPNISIHAPAWGATPKFKDTDKASEFQSTLPHGERHDPAKAAAQSGGYFNPRSRMGSDSVTSNIWRYNMDFNPRSRMGSDGPSDLPREHRGISIHAPAWGATRAERPDWTPVINFNPRSRMGSDGASKLMMDLSNISIHAPAWGATL